MNLIRAPNTKTKKALTRDILIWAFKKMVGLGGFEPPTSRLSGVRSNQLSYRPFL